MHATNSQQQCPFRRLAILASGTGTNAEHIIKHFQHHALTTVTRVLSNKADAGVLNRARRLKVPVGVFDRSTFYETDEVLEMLKAEADFVILAGFLWKVPEKILRAFPNKIINIHPALLPKYGGKGMYGHHVHQAAIDHKEPVSGITIHFVNEHYDEGAIVFQQTVAVAPTDTPESLAQKIHKLEHTHFPAVIEAILSDNSTHG